MSDLGGARYGPACCTVRGNVVVLGGEDTEGDEESVSLTVEVLRSDSGAEGLAFTYLPPLLCGPRTRYTALPIDESESAEGQVLMLGGRDEHYKFLDVASRVVKVDLATGACTPHPPLLYERWLFAAARLPDGRVVCAGGSHHDYRDDDEDEDYPASITAEALEPPEQGSPDGAWRWRELPHMSVQRQSAAGCVLSDGRFAVFGGMVGEDMDTTSCEVLTLDGDERWVPMPPMLEAGSDFVCAAVGGCVVVAGGISGSTAVDVYEEALGRWRRLPCNLPHGGGLCWTGSALM
jgi:hypothetical protein